MDQLDPRLFADDEVLYLIRYQSPWHRLIKGAKQLGFMLLGWCVVGAVAFLLMS